jgi:hypothetical protein
LSAAVHIKGAAAEASGEGSLSIDADRIDGIIHVTGIGFWTPEQVDRHFGQLRRVIDARRVPGDDVRVLVDLRAAPAQSPETAARIGLATETIYEASDRVAIVLASSLAKLQMRRVVQRARHEMFISPDAALTWLRAYSADS